MKTQISCICLALILAVASGCKHPDAAMTAAPARDELPPENRNIPTLSASIGVEGEFADSRTLPIPVYPKIEPTPEQQKILGEPPAEPELDVLAFYRPQPGPSQGVSSETTFPISGVFGRGGSSVGLENPYVSSGVLGEGGVAATEYSIVRRVAGRGRDRVPGGGVGGGWRVSVGEGEACHIAGRASRY